MDKTIELELNCLSFGDSIFEREDVSQQLYSMWIEVNILDSALEKIEQMFSDSEIDFSITEQGLIASKINACLRYPFPTLIKDIGLGCDFGVLMEDVYNLIPEIINKRDEIDYSLYCMGSILDYTLTRLTMLCGSGLGYKDWSFEIKCKKTEFALKFQHLIEVLDLQTKEQIQFLR